MNPIKVIIPEEFPKFSVGLHRPIYLWAGPGTVRMNQLKFMGAPNDIQVHKEAHTEVGAKRMAQNAGFNWAYLMYNWGFPPEIEKEDWEDFQKVVPIFQSQGIKVFGYVQASNCVFDGSFKDKDWYAQTPRGNRIHYYTGRYMTCWLHPEWRDHLQEMVFGVIRAGADGVFFDNPWFGNQPLHLGGAWAGPAGCSCPRCQTTYRQTTGLQIPTSINPSTEIDSRRYLNWRANIVTNTLDSLATYARSLNPEIIISANDYDAIMQPSFSSFGIDLRALSKVQDVVMIENFSLPRWESKSKGPSELVNNALNIRTARAIVGDTPLSTDPYDKGIGFDDVYDPRRIQLGLAEAAACGTPMVVKGTEYVNQDGVFTLLTSRKYAQHHRSLKTFHQWLANNADFYQGSRNAAVIGLLYPQEQFKYHWDQIAMLYFGVCQTLTYAGLPWKVITDVENCSELEVLLVFDTQELTNKGPRKITVQQIPGWSLPGPGLLARFPGLFRIISGPLGWYYQAYFKHRWTRLLTDRLGITQWFIQSPFFRLPIVEMRQKLLEAIGNTIVPRISWEADPVLIEIWDQENQQQIHLVNYGSKPQKVNIFLGQEASGTVISFGHKGKIFMSDQIEIKLDLYSIIFIKPKSVSMKP